MTSNRIAYEIVSTGSTGNAVIVNNYIMIDCGVSFKSLKNHYKNLKLVLLTHIHSDHFNTQTIKKLATERPQLRFGCGRWLVEPLVNCKVEKSNIDVLDSNIIYNYGSVDVIPAFLYHNVPNQGYKLHFNSMGKMFYATDTNSLNGISAYDYDLLMVEANYIDSELQQRIKEKKESGEYAYEMQVQKNHMSKEKCDEWLSKNVTENTTYVHLHCHKEREEK